MNDLPIHLVSYLFTSFIKGRTERGMKNHNYNPRRSFTYIFPELLDFVGIYVL